MMAPRRGGFISTFVEFVTGMPLSDDTVSPFKSRFKWQGQATCTTASSPGGPEAAPGSTIGSGRGGKRSHGDTFAKCSRPDPRLASALTHGVHETSLRTHDWRSAESRRPGNLRALSRRRAAPGREHPSHSVGKLRLQGGSRGLGVGLHQQVQRGLPRQALLRGAAGGRSARAADHQPRQGAVRRRARQRAALLGLAGQPGRLSRVPQAGRQGHGAWRSPWAAT